MSDSDEFNYCEDLAEEWELYPGAIGGGGGGATKPPKKKRQPQSTTFGKQRYGGTQAWGSSDTKCSKSCTKKCCSVKTKATPIGQ